MNVNHIEQKETEARCPICSNSMIPSKGKHGWFFACAKGGSGCRGTRNIYFDIGDLDAGKHAFSEKLREAATSLARMADEAEAALHETA